MRTCSNKASPRYGFTLIEVLVVIVAIGILSAVVMISVGVLGKDREAEDQAKRLWAVLSQVKEESELLGRNVGVLVDQTSYEFLQFDADRWSWIEIQDDDLLAPRQLPDGLRLYLSLEGREVVLKPHSERAREKKSDSDENSDLGAVDKPKEQKSLQDADMAPQIMLLASGDVNQFDLRIERDESPDHRWRIFSKPDNTIEVEEAEDQNASR